MGTADDWFRSPDWDETAQEEFEVRLQRSRPHNRPQYIRIKALALKPHDPEAAEQLFERVVRDYPASSDALHAKERIGDLKWRRGDRAGAEEIYRELLSKNGLSPSGTSGTVNVSLAELLLETPGREDDVLEQLQMIKPPSTALAMNADLFRWEAALAIVSARLGEDETSRRAATRALALLSAPDQFSNHPGVGRAVARDEQIAELRRLSGGIP